MIEVKSFTFNPFMENSYVLHDQTGECIIIDPGCSSAEEENTLSEYITSNELKPVRLINTHCHIDHIVGNAFVSNTYKLDLEAHKLEIPVLASTEMQAQYFGFSIKKSPDIKHFLEEGDQICFGNSSLDTLFTPGHCPGEVSFYSKEDKFIIGGDVLFQLGIGRTDLPGGDYATLIDSIRNKFFTLEDDCTVYAGHGPSTNIAFEKANNPFLQ